MRLQHGGAYMSDLNALRGRIRANGTVANIAAIPVTHPHAPGAALDVYMNLAYQSNGDPTLPAINGSLYVVGFGNPNGVWHFGGLGAMGAALPGVGFPGGQGGDYAALGFAGGPLPAVSDVNLGQAVAAMSAYAGGPTAGVTTHMTRLIVAVSEAVRLAPIATTINTVLGSAVVLTPSWDETHNWGGNRLGD